VIDGAWDAVAIRRCGNWRHSYPNLSSLATAAVGDGIAVAGALFSFFRPSGNRQERGTCRRTDVRTYRNPIRGAKRTP